MLTRLSRHLRRNLVAYLALFFGLAGTSFGAAQVLVPANSVGTRQVIDNSLQRVDFKRGQLPRGPRGKAGRQGAPGARGPTGPRGAQGAQGLRGLQGLTGPKGNAGATDVVVRRVQLLLGPGTAAAPPVSCEAGERATGGGVEILSPNAGDVVNQSLPLTDGGTSVNGDTPNGWGGGVTIAPPTANAVVTYAICSSP